MLTSYSLRRQCDRSLGTHFQANAASVANFLIDNDRFTVQYIVSLLFSHRIGDSQLQRIDRAGDNAIIAAGAGPVLDI
jgi:hypothetical protein